MTFDHELCILFLYHKFDELTIFHLNSLRSHNQDACIVLLTDTVPQLIPGSIDVGQFASSWEDVDKWRSIDTTLYRWFENRELNARNYIVIEYDCLCTVNLNDYYADVKGNDVVGIDFLKINETPHWPWFYDDELKKLPQEDRELASGIVPFTCTMFTHKALEQIVANVYRHDVFCELRLGTTIRKLKLNFVRLPILKRSTIRWHTYPWQTLQPGLFHAIKSLNHNIERRCQPNKIGLCLYELFRRRKPSWKFLSFLLNEIRHEFMRRLC